MTPEHIAAFSLGDTGGNPAGVCIGDTLPSAAEMQRIAAELGYSETVFAMPEGAGFKVRYYAPESEVAFCGHATIALGAALGARDGAGIFALSLRDDKITVEAWRKDGRWHAALQSAKTWSRPLTPSLTGDLLALFGYSDADLDPQLAPRLAFAGVRHGILFLKDRARLAQMDYPFEAMQQLMRANDLVTVSLLHRTGPRAFASRNAFASGGVVEDPATGAAAAALGGALVDLDWDGLAGGGTFVITQGEDMGMVSRLEVSVTGTPGASVRVSGATRLLQP